ncbi:DHA2 family efflux MFS transporter permease subunit [Wielerella bovis]|uniref:DHA2 family efflux MFS transporter permease subunit n=1 Tax=Wielerella bovis TaxID=2917790 RepID=UPI002019594E|nr:DHA2 family efflux MFS transporter permease subunit [Wielerella bovis]ULJ64520.1 DHA2 family efflux MFS transporter permease subunit [Wielerella bovis]ULJ66809.1 DHA2 family efflux MFS transporter permease subunit [Wielerella bovis]
MTSQPHRFLPMLLALCVFMQMLDATILNTALPTMARDLNESPLHMQTAIVSYVLTLALLMPLSGWLCDRFGIKRVFFWAMIIFVAGSALCAAAPNLSLLVLARIVQGIGGAMMTPVPRLVMVRAYDKSQLINMMNYVVMPALIGPILGPVVGGYLVEYVSWHWIFLINLPFGLAAAWFTHKIMPDFPRMSENKPFDLLGFLLFGSGAVGISFAVELIQYPNATWFAGLSAFFACSALFAYTRHAHHIENPLYDKNLFRVRTYRLGLSGNLMSRIGMSSMPFLLPLLLQVGFGHSAALAGWALAPVALASIAAKPLVKPMAMRLGYRKMLIVNTCMGGIIIMLLAVPSPNAPLWTLLPLLLLMGLCNSIQFTGMNTLTLADLRQHQAASGTSLMSVNQQLAVGFGTAISAALLRYFSMQPEIVPNMHTAFRYTLIIMGSFTIVSGLIFARLHPRDGENLIRR